jgi:hypothetical protein
MQPPLLCALGAAGLLAWPAPAAFAGKADPPGAVPVAKTKVTDVWVVFKTHFDIGYTDLLTNVLQRYRGEMMDNALALIEGNQNLPPDQRFVWTVPGWPLHHILGPLQTPERRVRIEKAIREGALAVHALPFTHHTESLELEDLVRGLHFSAQIDRDYGLPLVRSAKMTDVPEHCWVLPTLLKHAGVDFLHLGCNSACQYPRFPRLFYWEGPDGSRVLCDYSHEYGGDVLPPEDWPARNYLAMIMANDNHGPPTAAEVQDLRQRAAKGLPGVKIHFGTLDDFLRAIEAEKPQLPVVRGDTPDTWIHGLMSMPQSTKLARDIRPLESALDSLDTHLKLYGLTTAPLAQPLADAYENSLLYGEHTWGLCGDFGGRTIWPLAEWKKELPPDSQAKFLKSFDDHRAYIRKTDEIVTRELQSRLKQLAQSVQGASPRLLIWNALPWERSGLVDVDGKELYAIDVPPNGYMACPARFLLAPAEVDSFYTPFYRVTFDLQRGGISSLVEKKTERELVDRSSPFALGQYLHERFSRREVDAFFKAYSRMSGGWALADLGKPGMPDTPYLATSPGQWKLSARHSPFTDVATLTAGDTRDLAKACALKFTFSRYDNSVEVEWTVTDKTPDKTPEGGWLCFPFAVEKPRFTLGRVGGPVNPATDIIAGANRHLCAVSTGVFIDGPNQDGVSLCPLDSPVVSLDRPGLWLYDLDFVPQRPSVFVNLYNNKWNTNFPLWQEGSWSERVCFWPGKDLVVRSWEKRVPLLAVIAEGPAGDPPTTRAGLGVSRPGLSVSRPGVLVTAFGGNPDGPGTLLRVWEQSGVGGDLTVTLPGNFHTASPVNLRGEPAGKPTGIQDRKLVFKLPAYAPASYVLE